LHTNNGGYEKPSFENSWRPAGKSFLDLFLHALPFTWITNTLIPMTHDTIKACSPNCNELMLGEFLRYLGVRLLMATCIGLTKDDFWAPGLRVYDQECNQCPYNLKNIMLRR
jgi:hypothetical protein